MHKVYLPADTFISGIDTDLIKVNKKDLNGNQISTLMCSA